MDLLKNGTNIPETSATLQVRVLFLDVDGVLHPAMSGIQLQKALGTEETMMAGRKRPFQWGKSREIMGHDDGMMINDHILGCQICSHTSIIVRNPDQI